MKATLAQRWTAAVEAADIDPQHLNTRSNGTSRPNRGPSSTTTLDESHGRNYGRVANGGS